MEVEAAADALGEPGVEALAEGVAGQLGLLLPGRLWHRYAPQGLSFVRHGPEGRLAIHTWPERGVATLDVWAPRERLEGGEGLAGWLAGRNGYRMVAARLHHPPPER